MATPAEDDAVRISIFLRVRPVPNPAPKVEIDAEEGHVAFNLPRDVAGGYVNNSASSSMESSMQSLSRSVTHLRFPKLRTHPGNGVRALTPQR
jgi:hypothetical protein